MIVRTGKLTTVIGQGNLYNATQLHLAPLPRAGQFFIERLAQSPLIYYIPQFVDCKFRNRLRPKFDIAEPNVLSCSCKVYIMLYTEAELRQVDIFFAFDVFMFPCLPEIFRLCRSKQRPRPSLLTGMPWAGAMHLFSQWLHSCSLTNSRRKMASRIPFGNGRLTASFNAAILSDDLRLVPCEQITISLFSNQLLHESESRNHHLRHIDAPISIGNKCLVSASPFSAMLKRRFLRTG